MKTIVKEKGPMGEKENNPCVVDAKTLTMMFVAGDQNYRISTILIDIVDISDIEPTACPRKGRPYAGKLNYLIE